MPENWKSFRRKAVFKNQLAWKKYYHKISSCFLPNSVISYNILSTIKFVERRASRLGDSSCVPTRHMEVLNAGKPRRTSARKMKTFGMFRKQADLLAKSPNVQHLQDCIIVHWTTSMHRIKEWERKNPNLNGTSECVDYSRKESWKVEEIASNQHLPMKKQITFTNTQHTAVFLCT